LSNRKAIRPQDYLLAGLGAQASCCSPVRPISGTVLALAAIAKAVSIDRDYSVRATASEGDEIGNLAELFNETMHQVHQRDAA
jgi:hypothetical protein